MRLFYKSFAVSAMFISSLSCKKFVEVQPPITSLVGNAVYSTNSTAAAALTGIYLNMAGGAIGGGNRGMSALLGLSADEFDLYPSVADGLLIQTFKNALQSNNPAPIWGNLYNCIYQANSAIEGINNSTGVTSSMKQQLIGEAKFIRAFCHFYLVNIYGDVPLVIATDYKVVALLSRASQTQVYEQIIADLEDAQMLLSDDFLAPDGASTQERVRPNKGAAAALLARVYLYNKDWAKAEVAATSVISNGNQYSMVNDLDGVFLANSSEAIWQLQTPNNGFNTPDAGTFLLSEFGGPSAYFPFILNDSLVNSFEPEDRREKKWVNNIKVSSETYYFPFKYKLNFTGVAPTEYTMVLRLAEQYLIRAEARAQLGKITDAQADLNVIRSRAGLENTNADSQPDLLAAIERERRFELFTEYGHRWLDLKRSGKIDAIMGKVMPQKGGAWQTTDRLYPIPLSEILADGNLTQNDGYN